MSKCSEETIKALCKYLRGEAEIDVTPEGLLNPMFFLHSLKSNQFTITEKKTKPYIPDRKSTRLNSSH